MATKKTKPSNKKTLLQIVREKYPFFLLWGNPVGKVRLRSGKFISLGLGVGSADYIGLCRTCGIFVAIEVKKGQDKLSEVQRNWLIAVRKAGGIAMICRLSKVSVGTYPQDEKTPP